MRRGFRSVLLFFSLLMTACGSPASGVGGSGLLTPVNGEVSIPLAGISDGKAHFYQVRAGDATLVHFFVIKSNDGVYRAAVDACDVCYKDGKGYHQEGDFMVCDNCGQQFASARINDVRGGCSPVPLERVVRGDQMVISLKDINANVSYMKYRLK